ncbi:abortive infection family protein [uncultured Sphingomonas sp.]|uniref:abortive infection family protein n=1 Tax=uncultured Sphingomonas sp. TaxID=158754 RepID=UPI0035CBF956
MAWDFETTEPRDPIADLPTDRLERAMAFRNGLVALCEGWAKMDENVYSLLRREFMNDPITAPLLPQFVKTAQDRGAMWAFMKDFDGQWEPRRRMVRNEFAPLIDALERGPALADDMISDGIASFDALGVKDAWNKALARRDTDPEGAITSARTLLETVCKHLLEDADGNAKYGEKDDLPKLYRLASERLNIAPSQHSEDAFKRILGSAASVVEGLGTLRNKIGDAHASGGRKPVKVAPRHAALAVNLAGSMALFLLETASAKGVA